MTEIYRGKRLAVERREYVLPNGKRVEKVSVHPGNAVAMLPFFGDGSCCLIRQFRFVVGTYILEAPAGTLEPGEDPLEAARRELIEETGFDAETFIPRGWIYTTPGFSDEVIFLYEVRGLFPSSIHEKDEDEVIETVRVRTGDLPAMVRDGRISDAKTISLVCRCMGQER
ncbi:MAG: NUDIX hydrolase [Methanolinea sp.]|jgi:ADP-ribose pyrophosphatase|nr:NUDIX hydrolase [Methanolinea sp.]